MNFTFITSLDHISAARWNALVPDDYPFIKHQFLNALELSASLNPESGWQAQHLLVEQGDNLIAAVPLYLKTHSYGEYVFDWAWADAYKRYGFSYYPKLISAIPFTPCAGTRILFADPTQQADLLPVIVEAIKNHADRLHASSWHCLFPDSDLSMQLSQCRTSQRLGCQFHWYNRDYKSWDDFVAQMNSRKRKNINKERRHVQEQGITFAIKEGNGISEDDCHIFYNFYRNTYLKRSGHQGYLTEAFFTLLHKNLPESMVMITAQHNGESIAAALYLKDSTTIYGRYWGCLMEYDFLHFETCYYQGIEYAIQNGLKRFDGGAQGEHKIQRGFEPTITYSNHWLARSDFQNAIDNFLLAEKTSIKNYIEDAEQYLPFK